MLILLVTVLLLGVSVTTALPYTSDGPTVNITFPAIYGVPVNGSALGSCGEFSGLCPAGLCCSQYGYCGNTSSYCGAGCQPSYGTCGMKSVMNDTSHSFSYLPACSKHHLNQTTTAGHLTRTTATSTSLPETFRPSGMPGTANTASTTSPAFSFAPLSSTATETPGTGFAITTDISLAGISFAPLPSANTTPNPIAFVPLSGTNTGALFFLSPPNTSVSSTDSPATTITVTSTVFKSPVPLAAPTSSSPTPNTDSLPISSSLDALP